MKQCSGAISDAPVQTVSLISDEPKLSFGCLWISIPPAASFEFWKTENS
ncbi:MAG: hypothetical protein NT018_04050 [Armatimonadetes bacterium]|nr:hypothetical protein [Armatimonadota bacterium]